MPRPLADADTRDADTRDADTRDADTRDADTRDADTRDADTRDADTRDADTRDADTAPRDTERSKKRQRIVARDNTLPRSGSFFIGRATSPPYVFGRESRASSKWVAKKTNAKWIDTGDIDMDLYAAEVGSSRFGYRLSAGNLREDEDPVVDVTGLDTESDSDSGGNITFVNLGHYRPPSPLRRNKSAPAKPTLAKPTLEKKRKPENQPRSASTLRLPAFGLGGWSAAQDRALWQAQLKHGECKNWAAVVAAVNAVGPAKSQNECRHKWTREKVKVFGK